MSSDPWNPQQYEQFKAQRAQPALDLMALIEPKPGMRVVDLGCGTGELTRTLHERLAAAETLGVDNSENMLREAARHGGGGLRFEKADVATFTSDAKFDVVFSNAVLTWIPDHEALLGRFTQLLAPGGQLAVQLAMMDDHPVHFVSAEIARETPFRDQLGCFVALSEGLEPEEYATLLFRLGYQRQNVRLQIYPHVMPLREALVQWIKGTLLTAYERRLPPDAYREFLDRYRQRLFERLPDDRPIFYPYKRLLFWGRR